MEAFGLNAGVRVRAYVVGLGNAVSIVTVYSYATDARSLEAAVAEAEPIVLSFKWACNAEAEPGPCWGPPDASGNPATPPPR